MGRIWPLLVLAVVLGTAGCGAASAVSGVDRYRESSASMEPTVKAGQVVTVRKVGHGYTPRHGDIVLFHGTGKWSATPASAVFLKRVVAVGGEVIACCDSVGRLTINNSPLDEPYVKDDSPLAVQSAAGSCLGRKFGPVTVPPDMVFLMGDNRMVSNDSRCEGPVPASSVFAVITG
jgi:signal peptidase I